MEIFGNKKYLKLHGSEDQKHELPPLLWRSAAAFDLIETLTSTEYIVRSDEMRMDSLLTPEIIEMQENNMRLSLLNGYIQIQNAWRCGDSILRWIIECEETLRNQNPALRPFVHPDVWPNPSRVRFLELLSDKKISTPYEADLRKSMGLRLHYRRLPEPRHFSGQAILYSNNVVAEAEYKNWVDQAPKPLEFFPPEQFHFQVISL